MRSLWKRFYGQRNRLRYGLLLLIFASCLGMRLSCREEGDHDCGDPRAIRIRPGTCETFLNRCYDASPTPAAESIRLLTVAQGLSVRRVEDSLDGECLLCAASTAEFREEQEVEYEYTSFYHGGNPRYGYGTLIVTVSDATADLVVAADASDDTVAVASRVNLYATITGGPPEIPLIAWSPADLVNNPDSRFASADIDTTTNFKLVVERGAYIDSATVRVNVRLETAVTALPTTIGSGETSQLTATVQGGRPPYTFSWSPDDDLSANDVADPIASPTAATTYAVTVTDQYGQVAVRPVTVLVDTGGPLAAFATTDKDTVSCGETAALQGFVSGGTPPYTITWEPNGAVEDNHSLQTTFISEYSENLRLHVVDATGEVNAWVRVSVRMEPTLTANPPAIALGDSSRLIASLICGGKGPYIYGWSPAASLDIVSAESPIAWPTETTEYVMVIADALGQLVVRTVTVEVEP